MSVSITPGSEPDIATLARKLWGDPSKEHSTKDNLRFGSHGSKSVRLKERTWFDHEANEGGGYNDLYEKVYGERPSSDASIAATYDYNSPDGKLLYQVVRKIPKAFLQRRPDGNGGWIWKMAGIVRVPYRLPELLHSDGPVFICEGEKDCDRLRALGLTATTNPGGAGKWLASMSAYLRDRAVVILPDNDQAGEDHALDVAAKLHGIAKSVTIHRLPGLPPKGDVSDWLAAGGNVSDLLIAPVHEPPPPAEEPPPPQGEDDYGHNVVPLPTTKRKRNQEGWKAEWHLSDSGTPLPTLFNAMLAMRHHPRMTGLLRYDEMARTALLVQQIPGTPNDPTIPRPVKDADVISIQEELQRTGLRRIAKATVQDAVTLRAEEGRFHPVLDYLNGLVWDGETRVTGWLSRYLGVEGSPYADTIGRLFMVALIARQFQPGCKADYMLILEGPQGAMKSSACRIIAGEWFSDNLPDLSRGDAVRLSMHLRGKWLIEIAEMSSFNSAEAHTLKEFLTQTEERYTPKYGRNEVCEPRRCLFIGSTNEGTYLRDATGARRFWPIKVGVIDIEALTADRDQLLAEAVVLYREGAPWWPDRDFEVEHIAPQQAERYEVDPWQETIDSWLKQGAQVLNSDGSPVFDRDNNPILSPPVSVCTTMQILRTVLNLPLERINMREQRRVAGILTNLGWVQKRTNTERLYYPPTKYQ